MKPEYIALILATASLAWQVISHIRLQRRARPKIVIEGTTYRAGITRDGYIEAYASFFVRNRGGAPGHLVDIQIFVNPVRGRKGQVFGEVLSASAQGDPLQSETGWLLGLGLPFELSPFQTVQVFVDVSYLNPAVDSDGEFPIRITTGTGDCTEGELVLRPGWMDDARGLFAERVNGTRRKVQIDNGNSARTLMSFEHTINPSQDKDSGETTIRRGSPVDNPLDN